jgi:DNA recombination protein RmuC
VLFLPGDQFLSAALAEKPDLIDSALKQRIIVTTPSTLMALLKVIAYGWRQTHVTENAREIRELGQDLHKRLCVFVNHLQKVGLAGQRGQSFNAAVGSMERSVLPQSRSFGAGRHDRRRSNPWTRSKRRCHPDGGPASNPTNPRKPAHTS